MSYRAVAAQILALAHKGYLTLEETEHSEFLLQRTWRESDLGLTGCDMAISRAFYENRPTRFSVAPQSAPAIMLARQNLCAAIARELELAHWRDHRMFLAAFWGCAVGAGLWSVLLSPAHFWVILGPLMMFGGAGVIYWAALEGMVTMRTNVSPGLADVVVQCVSTRRGIVGLGLFAAGLLIMLFGSGLVEVLLCLVLVVAAFSLHRMSQNATHFGVARGRKLDAMRQFILADTHMGAVVEINPTLYEQIMPYAAAWGLNKVWAERFKSASAEMDVAPQRPRWLATPNKSHEPEFVAKLVYDDVVVALEHATGTKARMI